MKKYPFSKKAVKAILAASIALTPLASVGVSPISAATEIEADYDKVTELVSHFNKIYDSLDPEYKQDLLDIRENLQENVTYNDWERILEKVEVEGVATGDKVAVAQAIAKVVYSATPEELEENAADFQKEYTNQKVRAVFGNKVTSQSLLKYLAKVEVELFESLDAKDSEELLDMTTLDYQIEILTAFVAAKAGYTNEYNALTSVVTLDNLVAIRNDLRDLVDPTDSYKAILVNAFTNMDEITEPETPGGGGGGGGTTPPDNGGPKDDGKGKVGIGSGNISAKASEVAKAIKDAKEFKSLEVTLSNKAQDVSLPPAVINAIIAKNKEATIDVVSDAGSYSLPASEINLADIAKELGGDADKVSIKITVKVGKDDKNVIGNNKLTAVSDVVEFTVEAEVNGKKKELKTFKSYVDRTIKGKKEFDADKSVALRLEANGKFTALPTYFEKDEANVKSMTNSQYVVVENNKTFKDLSSVWNKDQIEKLANKYIVQGQADGSFGPYVSTTRVQLAVLLTRALGLTTDAAYDSRFKDVKGDEWFVPEVTAAVNAGIIQGKVDGSFDPYAPVSRAQAALMINRALEFVSYDKEKELDKTLKVENFKDEAKILEWARKDIETLLQAGIMEGLPNGNFEPYANTSRSQMVKILDETLKKLKFINE